MIEASAENVSRDVFRACLQQGVEQAERIADVIADLQQSRGQPKRSHLPASEPPQSILDKVEHLSIDEVTRAYTDFSHHKVSDPVSNT